jgi:hypothetical protein
MALAAAEGRNIGAAVVAAPAGQTERRLGLQDHASAGGSVGLLAGVVLTQAINWYWIFFVNLPIGVATAVLARRLLDRDDGIGLGRGLTSRVRC